MLLKTTEYDVLLVHPNKATLNKTKTGVKASLLSENAAGNMFTLEYLAPDKTSIDWMHPNCIKRYHKAKNNNEMSLF